MKNTNKRISYNNLNPPPKKKGIYAKSECVFAPNKGPRNKGENVIPSDLEILLIPLAAERSEDFTKVLIYVWRAETFIFEVKYLKTSAITERVSFGIKGISMVKIFEGIWVTNIVGIGPISLTIWAATIPPHALINPHNINTPPIVDYWNLQVLTYQNDIKLFTTNPPPNASRANNILVIITIL